MSWSKLKQDYVDEYLRTHPCVDCGETDVRALEFDHIDRESKIDNIGRCIRSMGMKNLIEEIDKCVVRCANHHSIRHFNERRLKEEDDD